MSHRVADIWSTQSDNSLITYYLTSVLDDMGLGPEMSRIIAAVNGTCYFLTSWVAPCRAVICLKAASSRSSSSNGSGDAH